jgi:hypothetical protein
MTWPDISNLLDKELKVFYERIQSSRSGTKIQRPELSAEEAQKIDIGVDLACAHFAKELKWPEMMEPAHVFGIHARLRQAQVMAGFIACKGLPEQLRPRPEPEPRKDAICWLLIDYWGSAGKDRHAISCLRDLGQ